MKTIFILLFLFSFSAQTAMGRTDSIRNAETATKQKFSPEEIKDGCTYNVLSFAEDVLEALNKKYSVDSIKKSIVTKDPAFKVLGESLVDAIVSADKDRVELVMNSMVAACVKYMNNQQKVRI